MASEGTGSRALLDRHVVITGGQGGLGGAVVDAFVDAGAVVHLPVRAVAPGTIPRARIHLTAVDLTDEAAVAAFYRGLPGLWASVHLAGGYAGAPITEIDQAALRTQIDINLVTAFSCCREAVRKMRASGTGAASPGGRIVNFASRAALVPGGGALAYAAAKAGVVALSQGLAIEVRGDGILVNALAPQTIDTPNNRAAMPNADFSRWSRPADIARTLLWLVAPDNVLVTGAVIPI
jgi:NAD(P)-dependent dehydrogenase (short-subunit alcohol dehydrogenase family)